MLHEVVEADINEHCACFAKCAIVRGALDQSGECVPAESKVEAEGGDASLVPVPEEVAEKPAEPARDQATPTHH